MLLCSLDDVRPGMIVGAVVLHPCRPDLELLSAGARLDAAIISRLRAMGLTDIWIHHDAMADLDAVIAPRLSELGREVYSCIKRDFASLATQTISTAQILDYRQTMMRLVFELVGNRKIAGLTGLIFNADDALFAHSSNVAYLAALTGLELEAYLVAERRQLAVQHARDVATLGMGAMLHDLGKAIRGPQERTRHEVVAGRPAPPPDQLPPAYRQHTLEGYRLLADCRPPASARQVVLNHHQRFDGRGWPDGAEVRPDRKPQVLSGRGIHIFCRIVAAANALDNLLRDEAGRRRPAVAALYDLAGPRYDGWFDPLVRQAMLRRIPPYQIGSRVVLSDGRVGAVVAPGMVQPCRPWVRLLAESSRRDDGQYETIALEKQPTLRIAECAGVDVRRWYFELPAPKSKARAAP